MSQRVITIGYMGGHMGQAASTPPSGSVMSPATSSAGGGDDSLLSTEQADVAADASSTGDAWTLFLASLPMVLVWGAGALALGYAAVLYFKPRAAPRYSDPGRRRPPRPRRPLKSHPLKRKATKKKAPKKTPKKAAPRRGRR